MAKLENQSNNNGRYASVPTDHHIWFYAIESKCKKRGNRSMKKEITSLDIEYLV
jgi:hypothetical protein